MRLRALLVCIAAVASSLSLVTAASAHKVSLVLYSGEYIDGSGSTYVDANGETQPYLFSSFLNDLAIHQNNGHLLVYDNGYVKLGIGDAYRQGIISQFTGSGIAEPFTSLNHNTITGITYYGGHIAVDNSATPTNGNFYITAPGEQTIRGFAESGAELGGNFPIPNSGTACGIAVDPGGNIWVVDSSDAKLIEYDSGGTATGTEFPVGSTNPCALAIDGAGNFYVGGENGVRKFNSSGTLEYQLTSDRTSQIATDPSNGDVYIGHGNETVSAFSSTGNFETNLEPGPEVPDYPGLRLGGIAVNGSNHEVYVVSTVNYGGTYHVEIYQIGRAHV